jgi:hypothetical protein
MKMKCSAKLQFRAPFSEEGGGADTSKAPEAGATDFIVTAKI